MVVGEFLGWHIPLQSLVQNLPLEFEGQQICASHHPQQREQLPLANSFWLAEVTQHLATSAWDITRGPSTATADVKPDSGFIQWIQSETKVAGDELQYMYIFPSRNKTIYSTGPRSIQETGAGRHTYNAAQGRPEGPLKWRVLVHGRE